jgi:hypothetical protein
MMLCNQALYNMAEDKLEYNVPVQIFDASLNVHISLSVFNLHNIQMICMIETIAV